MFYFTSHDFKSIKERKKFAAFHSSYRKCLSHYVIYQGLLERLLAFGPAKERLRVYYYKLNSAIIGTPQINTYFALLVELKERLEIVQKNCGDSSYLPLPRLPIVSSPVRLFF